MMKRIFGIVFSMGIIVSAMAQDSAAVKLTLQQCVEIGLEKNLDVQQSNILMQRGKINWNQSRLNMLPTFGAQANTAVNQGRSIDPYTNGFINQKINSSNYGVNGNVLLFNGLYLQNTAKQNSLAYEASKMDWQQVKDNLTIQIILSYLSVLSNQDQLTQAQNQAVLSKNQVDRLEIMNEEGAVAPIQLSDLHGQYAGDQLSIIGAKNSLETAKISLAQLMNVPYDSKVQVERLDAASFASKYEEDPAKIYDVALKQFALIKAVDFRKESSERGLKAAKGQLFPTLSAFGSGGTNYSSAASRDVFVGTSTQTSTKAYVDVNGTNSPLVTINDITRSEKISYGKQLNGNFSSSFGLSLQLNIFNGWLAHNRIKLARLDLKNSDLVAKTTKTQLQQSIEQAYVNMTTASERYTTLMDVVAAYKASFRIADIKFNSGVGTSVDYLTAKNNLDQANINLIAAKYDYVLRTKVLDYYQGKKLW